ncbi:hypothetical protein GUJ93_ZPchr0002g24955 [Zizania palustris]|uniref:Beta-amylase n=1 Tax=Zizania palustris TaxID=103762 RepID=A0A8J5VRM1_ZIZPA|nr:hypothetical protein GUJ93_ZPchr0002g24955 [Zizania palustris]
MQQQPCEDEDDEMGVKEEEDDDYYLVEEQQQPAVGRRGRAREEKERTKLRERQRRAITARILAGLRRHGNYNLRVRADINEVIAALAREAGWVVLPDGTTFPSCAASQPQSQSVSVRPSIAAPPLSSSPVPPLRGISPVAARPISSLRSSSLLSPPRAVPDPLLSLPMEPQELQVPDLLPPRPPERDFAGTPYVPVYVMLPLGVVSGNGEVVDADDLVCQLRVLKAAGVDGVMVDCWWGNVEPHRPQEYNWTGYKKLFHIIRELKLKLQVVMSFHECGGNVGDDVSIPLPHWVTEIGRSNPDIYFTDRAGRRNTECLSWGIDKQRVLQGRTAVEVYFDYMRSFRLRYPSYPAKHGWKYPGIGEFQCYDRYLQKSLRRAAEARGHPIWARAPDNAGHYNSEPNLTGFFCDGGDYDSYYGRFFLNWYSQVLVDHADRVLMLARLAFEGSNIAVKVSGVHWWYKTASHAAELTAGFYNPCNRDGYAPIADVLKKHGAALNFTCVELRTMDQQEVFPEAFADPEGLVWQVLNAAWDAGIPVASENALPCYDRDGFNKILENAKPLHDPDGRYLLGFTYLRLSKILFERANFLEFERFVKRMHGEAVLDLQE